jgi:ketosteroid isomerase-like protein
MSQENVEIVRQSFEAWNRGDFDVALDRFGHEEIELHIVGGFEDLIGEAFVGRERIVGLWHELATTLGVKFKVEEVLEAGDRVVVVLFQEALGAESGAPTTLRPGQVWSFRDGKVIRVDSYYTAEQALEAAGLRE